MWPLLEHTASPIRSQPRRQKLPINVMNYNWKTNDTIITINMLIVLNLHIIDVLFVARTLAYAIYNDVINDSWPTITLFLQSKIEGSDSTKLHNIRAELQDRIRNHYMHFYSIHSFNYINIMIKQLVIFYFLFIVRAFHLSHCDQPWRIEISI